MNKTLQTAIAEVQTQIEMEAVGVFGFANIIDFFKDIGRKFSGNIGSLITPKLGMYDRFKANRMFAKLETIDYNGVAALSVYAPVGFSGKILPLVQFLDETIRELATIEERLYAPLSSYLKMAISTKDFSNVIWINKNLKLIDYDTKVATYKKIYTGDAKKSDIDHIVKFGDVYFSSTELSTSYEVLYELGRFLSAIDLNKVKKAETDLYDTINLYIKTMQEDPSIIATNKLTLEAVIAATKAAVNETELLSLLIFSFNTLYTSVNKTVTKLATEVLK